MGLLPSTASRSGRIPFEGRDLSDLGRHDEYRTLWGDEMAMIFQDPMTALNPVMKIGQQITESLRFHLDMSKSDGEGDRDRAAPRGARSPSPRSDSPPTRTRCPAACASAW